ncbi:hypothetical protein [Vibrio phage LV6]|nr:hypothetical protein [Vibrio phage LV6]
MIADLLIALWTGITRGDTTLVHAVLMVFVVMGALCYGVYRGLILLAYVTTAWYLRNRVLYTLELGLIYGVPSYRVYSAHAHIIIDLKKYGVLGSLARYHYLIEQIKKRSL